MPDRLGNRRAGGRSGASRRHTSAEAASMRWADDVLRRYQRQMGALEMPEWEQSVERRSVHSYGGAPRKCTKPATGLIDLDLVRGSTFPKAKPQQGVWVAARQGLLRALALPLYCHWWCRHVGGQLFAVLLAAYLLYALVLIIRLTSDDTSSITVAELVTPALVGSALSFIKWQVVACKETRRSGAHVIPGKNSGAARPKRRRKSRATASAVAHTDSTSGLGCVCSMSSDSLMSSLTGGMSTAVCASAHLTSDTALPIGGADAVLTTSAQAERNKRANTHSTVNGHAVTSASGMNTKANEPRAGTTTSVNVASHVAQACCSTAATAKPLLSTRSASDDVVTSRQQRQQVPQRSFSADSLPGPSALCSDTCRATCRADSHVSGCRARVVRIADLPEKVCCYRTDSSDSKSDGDDLAELSPSSSTSALSKAAAGSPEVDSVRGGRARSTTDSSGAELSCTERRDTEGRRSYMYRRLSAGRWRLHRWTGATSSAESAPAAAASHNQTSGSDSEAGYSSGASATSGPQELAVTWDPLLHQGSDRTGCIIWEGADLKKVDLTTLDICSVIVNRVEAMPQSTDYLMFGIAMSVLISLLPSLCRLGASSALSAVHWPPVMTLNLSTVANVTSLLSEQIGAITDAAFGTTARERVVIVGCFLVTLLFTSLLFFVLSVVERSFKQRLLYAKYFCYLTSARRAKKFELPHFRLKKVRNIKTWLSVRSCLKKRGPQRSVDTIVSAACVTTVVLVTCLCVELLENTDSPRIDYYRSQLVLWCFSLGVYLVRLMSLGSYINCKYRNLSVVLTEQINVYLQIEQKPHKKDRLVLANNVLKLASELLKELERPFTVLGFSANPFLYNATKLIVLSACSGVLSDMLGFKLKLYKIKLK